MTKSEIMKLARIESVDEHGVLTLFERAAAEAHKGMRIIEALTESNEKLVEALSEIGALDPYPSTEKNIRTSHKRHLHIAKVTLADHAERMKQLAGRGEG